MLFAAWENGVDGKGWRNASEGEKFPAANGAAQSCAKVKSGMNNTVAGRGRNGRNCHSEVNAVIGACELMRPSCSHLHQPYATTPIHFEQ
jgi:hypothetical protein